MCTNSQRQHLSVGSTYNLCFFLQQWMLNYTKFLCLSSVEIHTQNCQNLRELVVPSHLKCGLSLGSQTDSCCIMASLLTGRVISSAYISSMDMSSSGLIWAVVLPISREFLCQHMYSAQIIKLQNILFVRQYIPYYFTSYFL